MRQVPTERTAIMMTQQQQPPHGAPHHYHPHPEANELVDDHDFDETEDQDDPVTELSRSDRRVFKFFIVIFAAAIVLALIIAGILFDRGTLVALGVFLFAPYMIVLSAPVIFARLAKIMEDEDVREHMHPHH
jgi:hypothetical protein